jgi:hypothetical protein
LSFQLETGATFAAAPSVIEYDQSVRIVVDLRLQETARLPQTAWIAFGMPIQVDFDLSDAERLRPGEQPAHGRLGVFVRDKNDEVSSTTVVD